MWEKDRLKSFYNRRRAGLLGTLIRLGKPHRSPTRSIPPPRGRMLRVIKTLFVYSSRRCCCPRTAPADWCAWTVTAVPRRPPAAAVGCCPCRSPTTVTRTTVGSSCRPPAVPWVCAPPLPYSRDSHSKCGSHPTCS